MKIKKIIVHGGDFHADETLALALLAYQYRMSLTELFKITERKFKITQEEYEDPEIIILDIGRRYEHYLSNYDHHQSSSLGCAAEIYYLSNKDAFEELMGTTTYYDVLESLIKPISKVDITGSNAGLDALKDIETSEIPSTVVNTIRSLSLNVDLQHIHFKMAVQLMQITLHAAINLSKGKIKAEIQWEVCEKHDKYVVQYNKGRIYKWGKKAQDIGVYFLITPCTRTEGNWRLICADSDLYPIIPTGKETFLHNARFIASYNSKKDAIEAAENSI